MTALAPPPASPVPKVSPRFLAWIDSVVAWAQQRRKFFVALASPWLLVADHYLNGALTPHLWYAVVLGEAGAFAVYFTPNTPPLSPL